MISIEEKDKRFYLDKSKIKDAGLGVFASVDIKKGDHLEIIGVMVDVGSTADECTNYAKNYKFAANFAKKFDKHIVPMGFGGMINHIDNKELQNVELRYVKKNSNNIFAGSAIYYFIKNVNKGEEILGNYGPDYGQRLENEKYWKMFLDLDLYNFNKLKR